MKRRQLLILSLTVLFFSCQTNSKTGNTRVLVFSKTAGYRHSSIAVGKRTIKQLGKENGFDVEATEDSSSFNEDNLKKYAAVIFLNTTGNVLNYQQQIAFERF